MQPKEFLNQLDDTRIIATIKEAEAKTSGEIRVFVSHKNVESAVAAAQAAFVRLHMANTRERNAVLIFVAPRARQFAVIGDAGVHQRCGDELWRRLAEEMSAHFKAEKFTDGIVSVVRKSGELLAEHFPRRNTDQNELSDRVVRD